MAITGSPQKTLAAVTTILDNLFQTTYQAGLGNLNNWAPQHTNVKDTVKRAINYIFYGDHNAPTEVDDYENDHYTEILGYQLERGLRQFQDGIKILRSDYNDDDLGILKDQVNALAQKYSDIWNILAVEILNNGATAAVTTYDAVPLYDNAHVIGAGTFDNLLVGTNVFATDIQTCYNAMMLFPTDTNLLRPANFPTHVVHPVQDLFEIKEVLNNSWNPADNKATENVNKNLVTSIVEPRLTDVNDWFAFKSGGGETPFVGITNKKASSTGEKLVNDNKVSANGQITDKDFHWKIHVYRGLHPTHPHLHAKVVNP
jgi:phage major head subunit gpT-like protein